MHEVAVIGEDDRGGKKTVGGGNANRQWTPHGGVISPLLANCHLHFLERTWQRRHLKGELSALLLRFADGFVVMCRRPVADPFDVASQCEGPSDWLPPASQCSSLPAPRRVQSTDQGGLVLGAYLGVKNIGESCAEKRHALMKEGSRNVVHHVRG
ncbi:MAG TPA: hypothetical protein PLB40_12460 [Accumulibacter sp.]|nr:hypothetical protein [Accumulibacter sp.]